MVLLQFGPSNPFRSQQMSAPRNMLAGYAEPAHVNDFMFEQQRRTFSTFGRFSCEKSLPCSKFTMIYFWNIITSVPFVGYALDPSVDTHQVSSVSYIGAVDEAEKNKGNLDIFNSHRVILFLWFWNSFLISSSRTNSVWERTQEAWEKEKGQRWRCRRDWQLPRPLG